MGRFVRGMLLGLLMVFAAGVWPAAAQVTTSSTYVTAPSNGSVLAGHYDSDGKAIAFEHTIRGQANSNCSNGFSDIKFSITGPGGYSKSYSSISTSNGNSWSGGPSTPWDTEPLALNGVYSVRMTVTDNSCLLHGSSQYPTKADVKVANQPVKPDWSAAPAAASDGSAVVTLKWKTNPEEDIISYEVTRTGSDGTVTALVPPSACGETTCVAQDGPSSFPAEYSGSYSYKIVAVRSAPSGSGDACGNARCVKSNSSDVQSVTLTKPTPTPTPTDSPTSGGSPTPKPGGGGSSNTGGSTPSGGSRGNTRVLSFGGSGGSSYNDFYTGTYDENLPYAPKTLVIGGGKTSLPNARSEAAAFSEEPPNYRTIMLPVAGGLLAFLSAAHVRRLLIHF
ncbi:MAG: hypothetical protein WAT66_01960 [Actinomycetota bacterium]